MVSGQPITRRSVVLLWTLLALSAPAAAQTDSATLTADIRSLAKLSFSASSVSFPDADPDIVPQVPASGGPLSITAKARATAGSQVVLTLQAANDLRSGLNLIAASAITWTTTGSGFLAGTVSKTVPVAVARWTGSGVRSGTQTLYFQNLWTYPTGTYTTSLTYTLSAP